MKGWILALVLACALVVQWAVTGQSVEAANRRTRDAKHALDTVRARGAEREIGWARDNDSLKAALREAGARVVVVNDTVRLPITVYRELVKQCEKCAKRTDTVLVTNTEERAANDRYISALQSDNAVLLKRATLGPRFASYLDLLHDMLGDAPSMAVGADLRLLGKIKATGRVERRLVTHEMPRLYVGLRLHF